MSGTAESMADDVAMERAQFLWAIYALSAMLLRGICAIRTARLQEHGFNCHWIWRWLSIMMSCFISKSSWWYDCVSSSACMCSWWHAGVSPYCWQLNARCDQQHPYCSSGGIRNQSSNYSVSRFSRYTTLTCVQQHKPMYNNINQSCKHDAWQLLCEMIAG